MSGMKSPPGTASAGSPSPAPPGESQPQPSPASAFTSAAPGNGGSGSFSPPQRHHDCPHLSLASLPLPLSGGRRSRRVHAPAAASDWLLLAPPAADCGRCERRQPLLCGLGKQTVGSGPPPGRENPRCPGPGLCP